MARVEEFLSRTQVDERHPLFKFRASLSRPAVRSKSSSSSLSAHTRGQVDRCGTLPSAQLNEAGFRACVAFLLQATGLFAPDTAGLSSSLAERRIGHKEERTRIGSTMGCGKTSS